MHLLLAFAVAAVPSTIHVVVEGGAGPCVHGERVPASLARTLPGIRIVRGEEGDATTVVSVVAGARLSVTLTRDGVVELERDLANAADACDANADAVALVVERHLRDLGYVPPAPPPEPVAEPEPEPEPPVPEPEPVPEPVSATATATATGDAADGVAGVVRLGVGGEVLLEVPAAELVRPGALVNVRAGYGPVALSVGGGLFLPSSLDVARPDGRQPGSIDVFTYLFVGALELEGFGGAAGVGGGVELVRGQVSGQLFQQDPMTHVSPLVFAAVRYTVLALAGVGFDLTARLVVRPDPAFFDVEGADPQYQDPQVTALLGIASFVRFF